MGGRPHLVKVKDQLEWIKIVILSEIKNSLFCLKSALILNLLRVYRLAKKKWEIYIIYTSEMSFCEYLVFIKPFLPS